MASPEVLRVGFIKQQENRVFKEVSVKGITHWLDRKPITSDLVREPKPLKKELPKTAVSPIAEVPQGIVESFRNSRIGNLLGISTLKEVK